jgi:hypothetical protein
MQEDTVDVRGEKGVEKGDRLLFLHNPPAIFGTNQIAHHSKKSPISPISAVPYFCEQ